MIGKFAKSADENQLRGDLRFFKLNNLQSSNNEMKAR